VRCVEGVISRDGYDPIYEKLCGGETGFVALAESTVFTGFRDDEFFRHY
jgi:hypothetical protein